MVNLQSVNLPANVYNDEKFNYAVKDPYELAFYVHLLGCLVLKEVATRHYVVVLFWL